MSSRPRSLGSRLLTLWLLVVHLLGVGAVPLADARAERTATASVAHVESRDATGCPTAHDHAACTLCRLLSQDGAALPGAPVPAPAAVLAAAPRPARPVPPAPAERRACEARAPPTV